MVNSAREKVESYKESIRSRSEILRSQGIHPGWMPFIALGYVARFADLGSKPWDLVTISDDDEQNRRSRLWGIGTSVAAVLILGVAIDARSEAEARKCATENIQSLVEEHYPSDISLEQAESAVVPCLSIRDRNDQDVIAVETERALAQLGIEVRFDLSNN